MNVYIFTYVLLITELYQSVIKANQTENSEHRMLKLKRLLHELPEMNFETFHFLARHLAVVASKEELNKVSWHSHSEKRIVLLAKLEKSAFVSTCRPTTCLPFIIHTFALDSRKDIE